MKHVNVITASTKTTTGLRYAGRKILVLNKEHGARPGSKRARGTDIILRSKTTDQALKAFRRCQGINSSFIRHAVRTGLVKLAA